MFEFLASQQQTTDPATLKMIAVGVTSLGGGWAFYENFVRYEKLGRLVRLLRDTPTSRIGDLTPGLREVTGRLLAADEELRSPLQEIPCVSWAVLATRRKGSGEHAHTITVVRDEESCDTILRNKTGSLRIATGEFDELESNNESWYGGKGASSEVIQRFEKKYGQSAKGLKVHESVLPTRVNYTAVGTVVSEEGHLKLTGGPTGSLSLMSPKPESVIVAEFQAQRLTHHVLLVLIPFVMLSPTGFFMSMKTGAYSILTTFVVTVFAWVLLRAMEGSAAETAWSKVKKPKRKR
ncbi:MAG: hypothetical protein ABGZ53_23130 [Fuerstiella sp.]